MVTCTLDVQPYARRFRQPLRTARGWWRVRTGLLVKLTAPDGRSGWGEIAPLPEFGSETLAQAETYCQQLGATIAASQLAAIPAELPACQFGFESAWLDLQGAIAPPALSPARCAQLLPAGSAALAAWQQPWQAGRRCFKWKIGVGPLAEELAHFDCLANELPPGARLRLDANGSLDQAAAERWLQQAAQYDSVEFLEQPLPPSEWSVLLALSQRYPTPIALDESVATLAQLRRCYAAGWSGLAVVKPAIAGSPRQLRQFCQQQAIDAVFSSVFETSVGRRAALALAAALANPQRALGFGVEAWLAATDTQSGALTLNPSPNSGRGTSSLGDEGLQGKALRQKVLGVYDSDLV